jgi:hypothetical protein
VSTPQPACPGNQSLRLNRTDGVQTCKLDAKYRFKEKKLDLRLLALAITDAAPTVSTMMATRGDVVSEITPKMKVVVEVSD